MASANFVKFMLSLLIFNCVENYLSTSHVTKLIFYCTLAVSLHIGCNYFEITLFFFFRFQWSSVAYLE